MIFGPLNGTHGMCLWHQKQASIINAVPWTELHKQTVISSKCKERTTVVFTFPHTEPHRKYHCIQKDHVRERFTDLISTVYYQLLCVLKVLGDEDPAMRYSAVTLFCQPDNVFPAPTPEHTSPPQTLSRLLCSRRIRSQGQKRKLQFEKKKKMLRRKHSWCASLLLWIQLYNIFWMQLPCHFCMPRKNCSMDTGGQRKD